MSSPTPPKDRDPLKATRDLLDVSVTERAQFRSCRRRWGLQTLAGLEPKVPAWALYFGTCLHAGLETFYIGGSADAAHDAFEETWAEMDEPLDRLAKDEWYPYRDLGHQMLDNYFTFDKSSSVDLGETLAVEGQWLDGRGQVTGQPKGYGDHTAVELSDSGRLLVPIVHPDSKEPIPGTPCLSAKIDLLTRRKTPRSGTWVVDHKSAATPPLDKGLDFDDQVTGYCYAVWRWTGIVPRGVVYNVLVKATPKPPRINKVAKHGSHLSTAKDQLTTPDLYRQALYDHGLMSGNRITSEPHAECFAGLLARGWEPFFRRFEATRSVEQLLSFERRLYQEHADMVAAGELEALRYPNPNVRTCPLCPVGPICLAMEEGSDVDYIIEEQFQVSEGRK